MDAGVKHLSVHMNVKRAECIKALYLIDFSSAIDA